MRIIKYLWNGAKALYYLIIAVISVILRSIILSIESVRYIEKLNKIIEEYNKNKKEEE